MPTVPQNAQHGNSRISTNDNQSYPNAFVTFRCTDSLDALEWKMGIHGDGVQFEYVMILIMILFHSNYFIIITIIVLNLYLNLAAKICSRVNLGTFDG